MAGISTIDSKPAWAVTGFTLGFGIENWTLTQGTNVISQPSNTPPANIPPDCYADPNTSCVSLVEGISSAVIGSAINSTNSTEITTWSWQNPETGPRYYVSFTLQCEDTYNCSPKTTASFQVGSNNEIFVAGIGDSAPATNQILLPGDIITFRIYSPVSTDASSITVNNFSANVPGPLPAAGAASAFGFSRRLRRRVKGERPQGFSGKSMAASHPGNYLNLSPAALHSLPVIFIYTATPHRPTLAHSFATRHGLPAMSPAPALEPAANDIPAMQG